MKPFLFLILLFTLPVSAQDKHPFDNWLFKFFEGESEMFGTIYGIDGEELDQGAGRMTTIIDRKKNQAISHSMIRYKSQEGKTKYVSTVTPKGKNTFAGVSEYSNGEKSNYIMTLLEGNRYRSVVKAPNGITVTIEGKLKNESTIETRELIKDQKGTLLWQSKTTYKRAKKPKK